jgi:serpin B
VLAINYGTGFRTVDFMNSPKEARNTINQWVSGQTEGKIQNIIPSIDESSRLIITNAIYFNAKWNKEFDKESSYNGVFNLIDGSTLMTTLMYQDETFRYMEGEGYQALELPYVGDDVAMMILLPREDQFEIFEKSLDNELWEQIIERLHSREVYLTMPKFTLDP